MGWELAKVLTPLALVLGVLGLVVWGIARRDRRLRDAAVDRDDLEEAGRAEEGRRDAVDDLVGRRGRLRDAVRRGWLRVRARE